MASPESSHTSTLSPDDAFRVLGDETRLEILQTLGLTGEPMAFSELFEETRYHDSSNFNYHLEKLLGHFVRKTDDGYVLSQPGRRIVEAVLSGAVTDITSVEPTEIERECPFCSADIQVGYQQERVEKHCPECSGWEERPSVAGGQFEESGNLGHLILPPAGVQRRTPVEVLRAAEIWTATETHAIIRGVCSRCSARLDQGVDVCNSHQAADGRCDECRQRFGAMFTASCPNCIFEMQAPMVTYLAGQSEMTRFMFEQGVDPLSPEAFEFPSSHVDETILSVEPFSALYTFTTENTDLELRVDNELSVAEAA
jgi:DNA-binding transcriptional ArsR family regulator